MHGIRDRNDVYVELIDQLDRAQETLTALEEADPSPKRDAARERLRVTIGEALLYLVTVAPPAAVRND